MNVNTNENEIVFDVDRTNTTSTTSSTNLRPGLHWKTRFAFSVGHVLNDLCASMWFTYLLVYFQYVLKFSDSLSGIILLIGQVADGLATPFVGLQVGDVQLSPAPPDTSNSWLQRFNLLSRFGPRKSWHLFGTICILISFPFIFLPCVGCSNSSQWAQVIYYSGFIIIFQFGWAAVQVSHLSLIPVLAHDERSRTELTATRFAFTVTSNITIYTMTWVTLGVTGGSQQIVNPDDVIAFRDIVLIAISIGAFFSLIFYFGVDEMKESQVYHLHDGQSKGPSAMKAYDWLKEKQFYQVAALYMSTRLFVNLSQIYLPLWLQDNLGLGAASVASTPLALYISGFLASLFIGPLTQIAGRKVIYLIGVVIGLGACIYVWFGHGDFFRTYGIYGVASLFGAGGSTMLITSLAVTADLIGGQVESGAFVYGAMSFTDKLANGISVYIIQYLHPDPEPIPYYVLILAVVCGGAALLSLISLATMIPFKIGRLGKGYDPITTSSEDEPATATETSPLLSRAQSNRL